MKIVRVEHLHELCMDIVEDLIVHSYASKQVSI